MRSSSRKEEEGPPVRFHWGPIRIYNLHSGVHSFILLPNHCIAITKYWIELYFAIHWVIFAHHSILQSLNR